MRKWLETVKDWPKFKPGQYYLAEILKIKKQCKQIQVSLRFLEEEMRERTLTIHLPLPIRPEGVTADYFRACGLAVSPLVPICPNDTLGSQIRIQLKPSDTGWETQDFQAVSSNPLAPPIQPSGMEVKNTREGFGKEDE